MDTLMQIPCCAIALFINNTIFAMYAEKICEVKCHMIIFTSPVCAASS